MKQKFSILIFHLLTLCFFSCSNDDGENNSIKGIMVIDGNSYDLKDGVIENHIESEEGNFYNLGVNLFTTDIKAFADEPISSEKKFSSVYFAMWSESSSGLTEGTYTFKNLREEALTFGLGIITIDSSILSSGIQYQINSGEIEVYKVGSNYEIMFEGTTLDDKNIFIEYKGKLSIN